MNRFVHLALAALLLAATTAATVGSEAPADQYFGPQKMSALEIRSRIGKLARNFDYRWEDDASIFHDAQLIELAFTAWAQRYPGDSWLAPTAYHLAQLYQELHLAQARSAALATYRSIARSYPKSKEAHASRVRLAHGLPPLGEERPLQPTPNPYASPSATPYQPPPESPPPPKSPPPPPQPPPASPPASPPP